MQKTAYEMRISDWSSDVCSSDLHPLRPCRSARRRPAHRRHLLRRRLEERRRRRELAAGGSWLARRIHAAGQGVRSQCPGPAPAGALPGRAGYRSEEHTSELQSLMRISYAVFCLKKKTKKYTIDK